MSETEDIKGRAKEAAGAVTGDESKKREGQAQQQKADAEVEAEGGESATTTFTAPESGTVEFICKYHPDQMTGEISVR